MPNNLSVENWISAINIILGNFVDCYEDKIANLLYCKSPETYMLRKDIYEKASGEVRYLLKIIMEDPQCIFGGKIRRRYDQESIIKISKIIKFMREKMNMNKKQVKGKLAELRIVLLEMSKI